VAVSVAAVIRSLSYHVIHRHSAYDDEARARLHRELDEAATRLVLGQSMDIGWNAGWYAAYSDLSYERMVEWKTGALFGCAAAMGALTAGAPPGEADRARQLGVSFGMIYQMADDYLDVFGADDALGKPRMEDLRGGKLSAPVVELLAVASPDERESVVESLRNPTADRSFVTRLFAEYAVAERLRSGIVRRAGTLERRPGSAVDDLVAAVLTTIEPS
jgi:geranylgeranyl pyrophosphate synthase